MEVENDLGSVPFDKMESRHVEEKEREREDLEHSPGSSPMRKRENTRKKLSLTGLESVFDGEFGRASMLSGSPPQQQTFTNPVVPPLSGSLLPTFPSSALLSPLPVNFLPKATSYPSLPSFSSSRSPRSQPNSPRVHDMTDFATKEDEKKQATTKKKDTTPTKNKDPKTNDNQEQQEKENRDRIIRDETVVEGEVARKEQEKEKENESEKEKEKEKEKDKEKEKEEATEEHEPGEDHEHEHDDHEHDHDHDHEHEHEHEHEEHKETQEKPTPVPDPFEEAEKEEEDEIQWSIAEEKDGQKKRYISAGTSEGLLGILFRDFEEEGITDFNWEQYMDTFLITHPMVIKSHDLLDYFIKHYGTWMGNYQCTESRTKAKAEFAIGRLFYIINRWLNYHSFAFETDPTLMRRMKDFMNAMRVPEGLREQHTQCCEHLIKLIPKEVFEEEVCPVPARRTSKAMKLMMGLNDEQHKKEFQMLDYSPRQLAEQMTIVDSEVFSAIKPSEFYHTAWCKKDKETTSPNILRAINRFNQLSAWMQRQLVTSPDVTRRVELLTHYIQLGKEFQALQNFQGMMCINAALNNSSISRLKLTWEALAEETKQQFNEIQEFFNPMSNFKNYRSFIQTCEYPYIPFIAISLTDLTFIDENPDKVKRKTKELAHPSTLPTSSSSPSPPPSEQQSQQSQQSGSSSPTHSLSQPHPLRQASPRVVTAELTTSPTPPTTTSSTTPATSPTHTATAPTTVTTTTTTTITPASPTPSHVIAASPPMSPVPPLSPHGFALRFSALIPSSPRGIIPSLLSPRSPGGSLVPPPPPSPVVVEVEEELTNFTKLQLVSNVLSSLKKVQSNLPKYKTEKFLHPVEDLQNYFSDNSKASLLGKGKMTEELMSEKEIYQGSIAVEPRQRSDSPKLKRAASPGMMKRSSSLRTLTVPKKKDKKRSDLIKAAAKSVEPDNQLVQVENPLNKISRTKSFSAKHPLSQDHLHHHQQHHHHTQSDHGTHNTTSHGDSAHTTSATTDATTTGTTANDNHHHEHHNRSVSDESGSHSNNSNGEHGDVNPRLVAALAEDNTFGSTTTSTTTPKKSSSAKKADRLSLHDMLGSPRKRATSQTYQEKGEYYNKDSIMRDPKDNKDLVQGKKKSSGGSLRLPGMRRRGQTAHSTPSTKPWDPPTPSSKGD